MKVQHICLMTAVGLALVCASPAAADTANQKTIFTFSQSVELPGKTLPAGTYTFVLADSPSNRHIVQVFDKDQSQLLTTLLAVPADRLEPAEEPIVSFAERSQDAAPAVQYWFYPGRTIGHEFVYPREQATRIARATQRPVLSSESATGSRDEMTRGTVSRIDPQGQEAPYTARSTEAAPDDRAARDTTQGAETSNGRSMTPTAAEAPAQSPAPASQSPVASQSATSPAAQQPTTTPAPGAQVRQRDDTRSAMDAREAQRSGMGNADRPEELPETAGPEPMFLLLAVSSLLGFSALGGFSRRK